jgi:alpha-galactosidase
MVQSTRAPKRFFPVCTIIGRGALLAVFFTGLFLSAQALKAPCLTPPMGWNSYNCWNYCVTESQFMQNAHYLANLKKYGWEYCVVDFIWWVPVNGQYGGGQGGDWKKGHVDQYGRFEPDTTRFPSSRGGRGFKPLADSVHNLGLKFGIHLMRGVPKMAVNFNYPVYNSTYTCTQAANQSSTCPWLDWMYGANDNAAGQAYLTSMVQLCNDWGADYLKIDDLSAATYHGPEVVMYAKAIASVSREMVFSTSPGATPLNQAAHVSQYANMWRLVNDLWDTWGQLTDSYNVDESWRTSTVSATVKWGQGVWPDIDMLPFGHLALIGPVGSPRYSLSTYTKGEHRLMFLLWCVNNGPLMWGGHLPDNNNNPFYDSLMTNSDALFINQRGIKARVLKAQSTGTPIWTSTHPLDTTTKFLLLGNTSTSSQTISVSLNTIGFSATQAVPVKNVWTGATLSNFTGTFAQTIPSHDAGLYALGTASLVWPNTPTQPVPSVEKQARFSGGKVFFTTSNRYVVPAAFAGKTVRVSAFNLGGKLLNSAVTRDRSIQLYKDNSPIGEKVTIVKINEVR